MGQDGHPTPSALEISGLLEIYADDDRPTFILEKTPTEDAIHEVPHVVFQNAALKTLVERDGCQAPFEEWAVTLGAEEVEGSKHIPKRFAGRQWKTKPFKQRWVVAYCSQDQSVQEPTKGGAANPDPPVRSPPIVVLQRSNSKDSSATSSQRRSSNSSWKTISTDDQPPTRNIDWTRADVPGLSPYIQFFKSIPWLETPLGPMDTWPLHLRSIVVTILSDPSPRLLLWGPGLIMIYNEACVPVFGKKHPATLGGFIEDHWAEVWDGVSPIVRAAVYEGKATKIDNMQLFMHRNNYLEEAYFSFNMLPIIGPDGTGVGALDEFSEITYMVCEDRRKRAAQSINEQVANVDTMKQLWFEFAEGLEVCKEDVPYAVIYSVEEEDEDDANSLSQDSGFSLSQDSGLPRNPNVPRRCILEGSVGLPSDHPSILKSFELTESSSDVSGFAKGCYKASEHRKMITLRESDGSLPSDLAVSVPGRGFGDTPQTVVFLPIDSLAGDVPLGFLVLALNPRRPVDNGILMFLRHLCDILARSAALICLPEEQRRNRQRFEAINTALTQQLRITTMEAERTQAKFTRMATNAPFGMYMFGPDGSPLYVNDVYLDMLNVSREEFREAAMTGLPWRDTIAEEDKEAVYESWSGLLEAKMPTTFEFRVKRPSQTIDKQTGNIVYGPSWFSATSFPELDSEGNVMSIIGWMMDTSSKHLSEALLAQRLDDALEMKRQSENFIDMTSHEMRNPLSAILQSADGILSTLCATGMPILHENLSIPGSDVESIVDAAQTIILCAQHQKRIVDDILTLSKLDSNLLIITPDKVSPPSLIEKSLKMYEAEMERADVHATLQVEASYRELKVESVMLDASRLLQVVINLLTNAIKFTQYSDTREITVFLGASRSPPTGKHHQVTFIPPRATRPDHVLSSEDWGDGEELYIQIAVKDTGNGLTEEEMRLLFQRFSQASPRTHTKYGGSGLGLFISRELTELQGGQIGVCSEAGKGSTFTFFVKSRRWISARSDESGSGLFKIHTPTIAASPMAYTQHDTTVVPDAPDPLQNCVDKGHENKGSERPSIPHRTSSSVILPQPPMASQLHVLIVEDNLINQKVMAQQLRRVGCTVHVANHGVEALDFLKITPFHSASSTDSTSVEPTPLSLILMDLEMPTMDGLSCVKEIRRLQAEGEIATHVPVIAVTANARSEQIATAIEAGMDEVVTKPFRIPELVPQMEALVARCPA